VEGFLSRAGNSHGSDLFYFRPEVEGAMLEFLAAK
jgi:hypothetical protein